MPTHSEHGVYVYLFNADEINGNYGYVCNKMLFDSVLKKDSVYSRIYSGDVLLYNLCEQISEVKRIGDRTSISKIANKELYITLLTELVQSIKKGYNTISEENLYTLFARNNMYSIILTNYQFDSCENIDKLLKKSSGYVGAFELDMGNPLHIILFLFK